MNGKTIGIDLGGTKIDGVVMHGDQILDRRRVQTPQGDYQATLEAVACLVAHLEQAAPGGSPGIGIGMPGTLSPGTGLVKNANSTCLIGKPLKHDLELILGREVRLANDADCFTLSEATDGAAKGQPVVFGVILGTGVGGGLSVNGNLISGPNLIAGEWGHNPLPWPADAERPGTKCYCGRRGCIETFLSGSGLVRAYESAGGGEQTAAEIAALASAGDPFASRAIDIYCDRLARALASVINIVDPDMIVLGGGLSNISRIYEKVPENLKAHIFSDQVLTRIARPEHGDASGVRGAAWLWNEPGQDRAGITK